MGRSTNDRDALASPEGKRDVKWGSEGRELESHERREKKEETRVGYHTHMLFRYSSYQ